MCMKNFLLEWLACFAFVGAVHIVLAQADQSGFISIDCGLNESYYIAQPTGINYTSDASFTDRGESVAISSPPTSYIKLLLSARRFPEGERNCYTMRPEKGKNNKYLIRASFMYGNFDGSNNETKEFDLYLGEDLWGTLSFQDAYDYLDKEIIHTPSTDYIHVCLQKTGAAIPFISGLELRPLGDTIYTTQFGPLELFSRWDLGAETDKFVRYPDDLYDRWWTPDRNSDVSLFPWNSTRRLTTKRSVRSNNDFQLPSVVMSTAVAPPNPSKSLYMMWEPDNPSDRFYLYLHFAEVEEFQSDEIRNTQVYLNGEPWNEEFSPYYLKSSTKLSTSPERLQTTYELYINSTETTLPPIINAIEKYVVKNFKNSGTDDSDVASMIGIKSYYGLKRNWQGDPCVPRAFIWEGLSCNYDYNNSRVFSVNLSSSRLNGSITPHIANLTSIRTLDLSNNNLNGTLPNFLAELPHLRVLNLAGNNFNGPIPAKLLEKSKQGLLSFSIDELPNTKKNKVFLPILASILAAFLVVSFVYIAVCTIRRRKRTVMREVEVNVNKNKGVFETKNRQFTYSEVLEITNNFGRVIGKGGFGRVYHGFMGDTEVAVKMLNPSSAQGHKEFQAEANLLMSVHHKNLTRLVGYCNEGNNIGIIYEYMANGNLQQHLSEFSWEQRLRIAADVAQGLEYLHHGCKPPIIHRDVKNTNILLNEKFQAKLSDFGLSKAFASESGTHVSTNTIVGSPGYMDPEYHSSYKLTEKSDVYSFGVVLLEMITGKPALDMKRENRHITEWVVPFLKNGDIRTIVDERFKGNFNINSAWKAFELAMGCVARQSTRRPTMNLVVIELKECLAMETSKKEAESTSITGPILDSEYGPLVR